MKKNKAFLLSLMLIPTVVLAINNDDGLPIFSAIFMEAFVSIHMSLFVLKPLSEILKPEDSKSLFWKMFAIRAVILLVFDFFVTTGIAIFDFFAVFVGAFIVVPLFALFAKNKGGNSLVNNNITVVRTDANGQAVSLTCPKCGTPKGINDVFCPNCGTQFVNNNIVSTQPKVKVTAADFDPIYNFTEEQLLEQFIRRKMKSVGMDDGSQYSMIPESILKRKNILNIIFAILLFVFVSIIFFHFPIYTYVIGIIILVVFLILSNRYDYMDYLKKEIKARPSEKITNIIMNTKNSLVNDNSKVLQLVSIICAVILPLVIFASPKIMYEKVEGGYAVRFYAFGLTNFKTATIPETYKNEKVVGLRGNTFSNMPFLTKVTLPNSIKEIRGQAFKNDIKLNSVNIPTSLEYLGGGAFYNCKAIEEIILPDTLTFMGGETFYGATNLKTVKLSENLKEIRGDSFEYCTSLTSIKIPDSVTRIGGHAFYGDTALAEVVISENSQLKVIGSSAFRQCYALKSVMLPNTTYVNERAFKESPTDVRRYGEEYDTYNHETTSSEIGYSSDKYPGYEVLETSNKSFNPGDKVFFNRYFMALNYVNTNNGYATFNFAYKDQEENILVPLKREEIVYYGLDGILLSLSNNADNSVYTLVSKPYNNRKDYRYRIIASSVKSVIRFKSRDIPNAGIITVSDVKTVNDKNVLEITLGGSYNDHIVLSEEKDNYITENLAIILDKIYSNRASLDIYFN